MCKSLFRTCSKSCLCCSSTTLKETCLSPTWSSSNSSSFQYFGKDPETSTRLYDYSRHTFPEDHNRYIVCAVIELIFLYEIQRDKHFTFFSLLDKLYFYCYFGLSFFHLPFRLSQVTSWNRYWVCSRSWSHPNRTTTKDSTCSSRLSNSFRLKLSLATSSPFSLWYLIEVFVNNNTL